MPALQSIEDDHSTSRRHRKLGARSRNARYTQGTVPLETTCALRVRRYKQLAITPPSSTRHPTRLRPGPRTPRAVVSARESSSADVR
eukprot:2725865-Pyramimonas_sp.AAC.1